ncbi:hypothetical protein BTT_61890 (plasmid) [Bacillus thuringiensis serovar morrisoni str. 4AA1]|nr:MULTISPECIES: hypothetical protein [Bacillus]MED3102368.1 hypothetical protein [Bacillus thuringiensis]UEL01211.1 hypothetical protein K8Z23_29940 [Bacillus thuringiensis]UOC04936.1 hypothetical protein BTT_61890 [Bacillus thuringiensis serovar morrisoni str. 4AA1]WMR10134.1 hypothetical protein RCI28_30530 [Bacillus thuringiensis serovar tenebrionis]WMR16120.1 hypothetical protein RCI27_30425 [Bacillus thuringiensis serovar tenebrionis]
MKKIIFSLIGLTAVFTFMFNASNGTYTQKALSEDKIVQYAHGHTGG